MYNKENEFSKENELKNEKSELRSEEVKDESSATNNVEKKADEIDYSIVTGTKEYIYSANKENGYDINDENIKNEAIFENDFNQEKGRTDDTVRANSQNYSSAYNEKAYNSANNSSDYTSAYDTTQTNTIKRKKSRKSFMSTVALVAVVSMLSGIAGSYVTMNYFKNNFMLENTTTTNNPNSIKIDLNDDAYYAAAVNEKTKNTVVGITTTVKMVYETFWGAQEREGESIGSGIIVDPNGLILTNSHVIGDGSALKIAVSLTDGTTEEASVLWYDQTLDLAVIKINRVGLSAAELGDSDTLIVGEPVVAIGNPMSLALNGTLTNGVISGLNRSITVNSVTIKPLIQTNASINPGNSGGPLFNAKGQVIGINTAKMSSAEGLGFSIPINVVIPTLNQITKGETVSSLYIGIQGLSVADYQERMNIQLSVDSGVIILDVIKDGPSSKAGLIYGDIITAIDKIQLNDMSDLKRALYNYKQGDTVEITYLRNGVESKLELILEQKPNNY